MYNHHASVLLSACEQHVGTDPVSVKIRLRGRGHNVYRSVLLTADVDIHVHFANGHEPATQPTCNQFCDVWLITHYVFIKASPVMSHNKAPGPETAFEHPEIIANSDLICCCCIFTGFDNEGLFLGLLLHKPKRWASFESCASWLEGAICCTSSDSKKNLGLILADGAGSQILHCKEVTLFQSVQRNMASCACCSLSHLLLWKQSGFISCASPSPID